MNARGDTFVVVTQEGVTCRATAVDAATGLVRWRRDLGVTVKGDPLAVGNAVLLVDQAGGFYRVETTRLADRGGAAWLIDERWMIAAPSIGFTAATGLIPGPNGTAFMFLTGDSDKGPQLMIRRFDGTAVRDQLLPAPGMLAGPPTVSGQMVLLQAVQFALSLSTAIGNSKPLSRALLRMPGKVASFFNNAPQFLKTTFNGLLEKLGCTSPY